MKFPLGFYDISLWLGVISIILLTISELISPYYGQIGLIIEKGHLGRVAFIITILFLATIIIKSM